MDDCLLAFLAGFFTCAIGVFLALMFDIGMDQLSYAWKTWFGKSDKL